MFTPPISVRAVARIATTIQTNKRDAFERGDQPDKRIIQEHESGNAGQPCSRWEAAFRYRQQQSRKDERHKHEGAQNRSNPSVGFGKGQRVIEAANHEIEPEYRLQASDPDHRLPDAESRSRNAHRN